MMPKPQINYLGEAEATLQKACALMPGGGVWYFKERCELAQVQVLIAIAEQLEKLVEAMGNHQQRFKPREPGMPGNAL